MTRRRPHPFALRSAAVLGVAVALSGLTAPMSQALGLPEPVGTAVAGVTSTVQGSTGGLGLPVPGATGPSGTGSSTSTAKPSTTKPSSSTTTQGKGSSTPATTSSSGSSTKSAGTTGSGSTPSGAVVDSPAATACLIPTGKSSPAVKVDLLAAGVDLSSPLVKQFPQALAPCPAGAVAAGDHVLSVDAAIDGLLGACVRVTRQGVPVQTTLVVLDRDVIKELTNAGVPLDRLVVPCPKGAAAPPAGSTPSASDPAHPAASPGVASALPTSLAFTGSDSLPLALVGAGMLWLGVLLTRGARAPFSADGGRG